MQITHSHAFEEDHCAPPVPKLARLTYFRWNFFLVSCTEQNSSIPHIFRQNLHAHLSQKACACMQFSCMFYGCVRGIRTDTPTWSAVHATPKLCMQSATLRACSQLRTLVYSSV